MRNTPRSTRPRRALAVTAAALAIVTAAGCTSLTTTPKQSSSTSATQVAAGDVWDTSTVHSFSVETSDADYAALIKAYEENGDKKWIEATVTIDGTVYKRAGVKLKGNSTLRTQGGGAGSKSSSSLSSTSAAELPWVIRLDKYVKGQSHDGSTEFVVRGNTSEASLNEALALDMLAQTGLAAEPAVAARFSMNGSSEALRLVVENPDDEWMERALGDGLLYKAESGGDYSYRGADASDYADAFEQKGGGDDLTPLIDFLKWINQSDDATFASQLSEHLDVDAFANYLAFQDLVDNFDDIDGPGNNSYLYYDPATKRMTVVNWDLNLAFGQTPGGGAGAGGGQAGAGQQGAGQQGQQGQQGMPNRGQGAPGAGAANGGGAGGGQGMSRSNILRERFVAVPAFKALYDAAAAKLKSDLVDSGTAAKLLEQRTQVLLDGAADLVDAATINKESAALAAKLKS